MHTIRTRKKIGFPKKKSDWGMSKAIYKKNNLKIAGHPVMEDWEHGYMKKLATVACANGGNVLEVGYGMGLSAKAIQSKKINTHVVIECHPDVIARCLKDMRKELSNGKLHIMSGFWQEVTPLLADNSFEGILFDTYPLKEEEIHSNHFWFFAEAYRLLKPGGTLTYYSDEAKEFSPNHMKKILEAGFKESNIAFKICKVKPPQNCKYWRDETFIIPIIKKGL